MEYLSAVEVYPDELSFSILTGMNGMKKKTLINGKAMLNIQLNSNCACTLGCGNLIIVMELKK